MFNKSYSKKFIIFFSMFVVSMLFTTATVYASDGVGINSLTDLFRSTAFRGSGETLSKFGFFATGMNFVITIFSLIGLSLTLYQKFITLLYLSSKPLWDTVNELKGGGAGGAGGKGGPWASLITPLTQGSSKGGTGVDAVIHFVYGLLPDIKSYCDYSQDALGKQSGGGAGGEGGGNNRGKLLESDGVAQYMMKTALPTITLIFCLTIGFSGTLGKAYGVVVDGLAVAADRAVESNFSGYVAKLVGKAGGYDWSIPHSNVAGPITIKVAEELFNKTMIYLKGSTPEGQQIIGKYIETAMSEGNPKWLSVVNGNGNLLDLGDISNAETYYSMVYNNSTPTTQDEMKKICVDSENNPTSNFTADNMEHNIVGPQVVMNDTKLENVTGVHMDLKAFAAEIGYAGVELLPQSYVHIYFNWKSSSHTDGKIKMENQKGFDPGQTPIVPGT